MFVKDTIKIKDRKTGEVFECFPQIVDINFDGVYSLRYNIGINGYHEWTFVHAIYDNNTFNNMYKVIK